MRSEEVGIYGRGRWVREGGKSGRDEGYVVKVRVVGKEDEKERRGYVCFCKRKGEEEEVVNSVSILEEGRRRRRCSDYCGEKRVGVVEGGREGRGVGMVVMGDGFVESEIVKGR